MMFQYVLSVCLGIYTANGSLVSMDFLLPFINFEQFSEILSPNIFSVLSLFSPFTIVFTCITSFDVFPLLFFFPFANFYCISFKFTIFSSLTLVLLESTLKEFFISVPFFFFLVALTQYLFAEIAYLLIYVNNIYIITVNINHNYSDDE